jgi:uncharacterized protein (TIRG00374 family)
MAGRRLVRAALWLAGLSLVAAVLRRVELGEALRAVLRLDAAGIAALAALNLAALVLFTLRWWILLRGLGYRVGLLRASLYRLGAFGFSYFTPGPQVGGEPVQVLLVERRHGVPLDRAVASVALDRLLDAAVNLSFLLAAGLYLLRDRATLFLGALAALPVVYLALLARGVHPATRLLEATVGGAPRFERAFHLVAGSEAETGRFCRAHPGHLALALAASLASWALMLFEYGLLASLLGMPLGLEELLLGLSAARIAYLLFFPAALGVFEAGQIAAVTAMGFPAHLGVSMSLVIRLRDVLLGAIGLVWGLRALVAAPRVPARGDGAYSSSR